MQLKSKGGIPGPCSHIMGLLDDIVLDQKLNKVNYTIYVRSRTTSAAYFMHKSIAFKVEAVNKLEKPGTEKANIHRNNTTV